MMPFAGLLLVALALRLVVVVVQFDKLGVDRDGYRAIASQLAAGEGFSHSSPSADEPRPTAYRPPLYPLLLAANFRLGAGDVGIALLHVLLGASTVLLTYLAGVRLGLGGAALMAAGLVAVDPLLLQYTALPMTETLFTFLVALLLWLLVGCSSPVRRGSPGPAVAQSGEGVHQKSGQPSASEECSHGRQTVGDPRPFSQLKRGPRSGERGYALSSVKLALLGAVFGLCLLCRPTIGAFALLGGLCWLCLAATRSFRSGALPQRRLPLYAWPALLAAAVVVAPWVVRNVLVVGSPIAATTHGGYTLLLGNNPVFYRKVVARRWGTVWDDAPAGRTQADWLKSVEAELRADLGPLADDEPSRDRWMYRRALANIAAEPGLFLRACGLRFVRFWNIVPLGPARSGLPRLAVWGVGLFYGLEIAAFLLGTVVLLSARRTALGKTGNEALVAGSARPKQWHCGWCSLFLLIAAFSLVHLFYWSNMRMRAPVIPATALIAAGGLCRFAIRRRRRPANAARVDA